MSQVCPVYQVAACQAARHHLHCSVVQVLYPLAQHL